GSYPRRLELFRWPSSAPCLVDSIFSKLEEEQFPCRERNESAPVPNADAGGFAERIFANPRQFAAPAAVVPVLGQSSDFLFGRFVDFAFPMQPDGRLESLECLLDLGAGMADVAAFQIKLNIEHRRQTVIADLHRALPVLERGHAG